MSAEAIVFLAELGDWGCFTGEQLPKLPPSPGDGVAENVQNRLGARFLRYQPPVRRGGCRSCAQQDRWRLGRDQSHRCGGGRRSLPRF